MTKMTLSATVAFLLGFTLFASGCSDMYLADSIDVEFNFSPITGRGDGLHSPYVVGTSFTIWANDNLDNSLDEEHFTLESSNPDVIRINRQDEGSADCTALSVGESNMIVYDEDGDRVYSRTLVVAAPDRAEIFAHGPLIIGYDDDEALVDGPVRIVHGGVATFLVRYYEGDRRLYGNGVLEAREANDFENITLEARQSFVSENREWLTIHTSTVGTYDVELLVDGDVVGVGTVEVVPSSEVEEMVLLAESERRADDGEWLAVLAQAYDSNGDPLYGVECTWDIDGDREEGYGDLYRYEYDKDEVVALGANYQDFRDEVTIHASEGYVSSTNNIGCNSTSRRPSGSTALLLLALVATLIPLRRRPRETLSS